MEQTLTVLSHIVEVEAELEAETISQAANLLERCVYLYRTLEPMYYRHSTAAVVQSVLHITNKLSSRLPQLKSDEALNVASVIKNAANSISLVSDSVVTSILNS